MSRDQKVRTTEYDMAVLDAYPIAHWGMHMLNATRGLNEVFVAGEMSTLGAKPLGQERIDSTIHQCWMPY